MKYLIAICDRCKASTGVSLEEIIQNKNSKGTPKDWKYRDIGIDGEESYTICHKCTTEYNKLEADSFRKYVTSHSSQHIGIIKSN